ncbi:hypothetical protein BHM03_00010405 [Ensete ventricosum]|nr:hypothetical protein BHM03_00010405 [Ensete ventricosum]
MKNPWNDMILLLPLQEFLSLTSTKKIFVPPLYILSSMSTLFMWLGHFTMFHPSCSIS